VGVLAWIIFGALAGWMASILVGSNGSQGFLGNIVVGVVGALIGGYVMSLFGKTGVTGFNARSLGVAILGAVLLLGLVNLIT
jgi:uncharacterized membrane protein YeaQ/YmgE (transglycosylase-associated protein family)